MTVRAVVFDLFHTLANPEDFRPRSFDRIARVAGVFGVAADALRDHWFAEVVPVVVRHPDRPVDLLAAFAARHGGRVGERELAEADDALGRYQDLALLHPLPGAVEAVAATRAHGVVTGLLSNAHERDVRMWDRSPLAEQIDAAVLSCFAGVAKPEPAAYRRVLAALAVPAAAAMFVGDGGSDEFVGARAAGFGSIVCVAGPALASGFRTAAEMDGLAAAADRRVDDVAEIAGLLAAG